MRLYMNVIKNVTKPQYIVNLVSDAYGNPSPELTIAKDNRWSCSFICHTLIDRGATNSVSANVDDQSYFTADFESCLTILCGSDILVADGDNYKFHSSVDMNDVYVNSILTDDEPMEDDFCTVTNKMSELYTNNSFNYICNIP